MARANRKLGFVLALASTLALACDGAGSGSGRHGGGPHGGSSVGGQIVSTVNGDAITLAEVHELVAAGLTPREALDRLQAERLLAAEAQRRGVGDEWAVSEVERKAAVQALLDDATRDLPIADDELEAAFAKQQARFEQPERRAVVHVLASVSAKAAPEADAAARAVAERLAPELEHAEDLDEFVRTNRKQVIDGVRVIVERLPPMPLHGRLVQPFADAMFSVAQPGMVPGVVRTMYGWHAIRVVEILPPLVTPKEEALATLRKELLVEHQKARVKELLAQLKKQYPVQLSDGVGQALNGLAL